ncbi:hypothetical protein EI94DRAFT_765056 [Lactarius quietus]|nr:hypothetical protein EI94DRAFT_765056 [Lactarius quietus]
MCPIIVIGRKTTVIVFKIFGIERAWQNRGSVGPRPRQLFITKSQLLANKVEHDYVHLCFRFLQVQTRHNMCASAFNTGTHAGGIMYWTQMKQKAQEMIFRRNLANFETATSRCS